MGQLTEGDVAMVEGEIIRDSPLKMAASMVGAAVVGVPLGGALVWAWWINLDLGGRQISWYGALIGAGLFAVGAFCLLAAPFVFFMREQLVLGKDCFQIVGGKDKVTHQFPYRNIARLEVFRNHSGPDFVTDFIGIELVNPEDAQTLCTAWKTNHELYGWHYRLAEGSWADPLEKIRDRIAKRVPTQG